MQLKVLDIIRAHPEGPITLARKFNIITQQEADALLPTVKDPEYEKIPNTRLTGLNGAINSPKCNSTRFSKRSKSFIQNF